MKCFPSLFHKTLVSLIMIGLCMVVNSQPAQAKKKEAGPDPAAQADAEVKKGLDPINDGLTKLMIKVQSRALLSPEEAGQLADLKYKLMDLMNQYPQNVQLVKPVYQAGVLFNQREEYDDAYELFNYLAQGFPTNPYGLKAKGQMQQLEKRFGPGYFSVDAVSPAPTTATTGGTPATPATPPAAPKK
jgi:TolA-binding protein